MTDVTAPAQTDPTDTPVPDAPEPAGTASTPVPATEVQPRRRIRITGLRRAVVEAREHDTYRLLVRHGAYVLGGTRVLTRRAWEARTTAMHSRMIRQAEAAGN
ncbi:hypothetical protein ACIRL0_00535 [Streptomyces sp. NPDC102365]|uniref:hypothetical protein n=1 Tax=Streptomyces sp. NPDC102365 TaxID=3366162 RepID=UPI0037FCF236